MSANLEAPPAPGRGEVEEVLEYLIGNRCSKEQASGYPNHD
jgi:hypothetical protein